MSSSVTSFVAGEVVSKSVDDFSSAVESIPGLTPPRCNEEEYKRLLKYREKLRTQHTKMEADRQAMRRKIRKKYGIKETDRHKNVLSSTGLSNDEKSSLMNEDESSEKQNESCLSCVCCCFKIK